jgi:PAS domain S-box-containing protein
MKHKIAIAGGDKNVVSDLTRSFARVGYIIVGGNNAQQLAQYLEDNPLDLLILDLVDPPVDVGVYFELLDRNLIRPENIMPLIDKQLPSKLEASLKERRLKSIARALPEAMIMAEASRNIIINENLKPSRLYLGFLGAIKNGVLITNFGLQLLWANSVAEEMLGLIHSRIDKMQLSDLFQAQDDFQKLTGNLEESSYVTQFPLKLKHQTGKTISLTASCSAIYSDDNRMNWMIILNPPDESEALRKALNEREREYQLVIRAKTEVIEEQVRRRNRELQLLYETNRRIVESLRPEDVVETISTQMITALKADYAVFVGLDNKAERISEIYCRNLPQIAIEKINEFQDLAIASTSFGRLLIQSEEPLLIEAIDQSGYLTQELIDSFQVPVSSLVALVFRHKNLLLGLLILGFEQPLSGLQPEDNAFISALSKQAAVALENARLYRDALDSQRVAEKLHRVTRSIISELRLDDLIRELAVQLTEVLQADHCAFFFVDPGTNRIAEILSPGLPEDNAIFEAVDMDAALFGYDPDTPSGQQPQVVEDAHSSSVIPRSITEKLMLRSALVLPLLGRHHNFGFIMVMFTASSRLLSPYEVQLAMGIEAVAALMLENSRLFDMVERGKIDWERTVNATENLIWLVDTDLNLVRANEMFRQVAGITDDDLIGRRVEEAILKDRGVVEYYQKMQKGEVEDSFHCQSTLFGGRQYQLTINPVRDGQGRLLGAVHLAEDISERLELENELKRADKMSEIGKLASGMAHEINNPLNSILGYVEAIQRRVERKETDPDTMHKYFGTVRDEIYRVKGIVDNLLDFSRVSIGDKTEVEIKPLLSRVLDLLRHQQRFEEVVAEFEAADDLPKLPADKNRLQQAITAIMVNAFEVSATGGKVKVAASIAGNSMLIEISDEGPGIEADILPRIFDPFFSRKSSGGGLGLGLSISREIVELHQGKIDVESKVGEGSKFIIILPLNFALTGH